MSILIDNSGHIVYYEKNYVSNQYTNIIIYNYCQHLLTILVNVVYNQEKGAFRCSISDGLKFSTNVFFDPKICEEVEKNLLDKVSIVKLEIVEILQKCIVAIQQYTRLGDGPQNMGGAQFVGASFYRKYKPRGFLTPSRIKKIF